MYNPAAVQKLKSEGGVACVHEGDPKRARAHTLKPEVRALFAAEDVTFENARHTAIAEAFGWPSWVVGVSYDTIESGDTPDDFPRDQLVHITPA
jgi:hypothetical protein